MEMTARKIQRNFVITARNLTVGEAHDDVVKIQAYLRNFGYLRKSLYGRIFDIKTQSALQRFQEYFELTPNGQLDDETVGLMETPRCGNQDILDEPGHPPRYETFGCSFFAHVRKPRFTYENLTADLDQNRILAAIQRAFNTWRAAAGIDFYRVGLDNPHEIQIGWFTGAHGCSQPFDGPGTVLAHAGCPCCGSVAGKIHFDDAETWTVPPGFGTSVEAVALHEIGHVLGLQHSKVKGAVMFPIFNGRSDLHDDDVAGIQSLYGAKGLPLVVKIKPNYGLSDLEGLENEFVGSREQQTGFQAFRVDFRGEPVPGVEIEYWCHISEYGTTNPQVGGWCGIPEDNNRHIEAIAIRLRGPNAHNYNVQYMAHLQGYGDTNLASNGEMLGTQGESRRLEGILVRITPA